MAEIRFEERLMAPCCWRETLASHESPIARELRAEIGGRLGNGESPESIRAALEARYGDRIRAAPLGFSFGAMGVVALAIPLVGGAVLLRSNLRRRRVEAPPAEATGPAADDGDFEDRLDDELDRLD